MRVLIGCEESQTVCKAFRELGHEAYSNDLVECSGAHPEWHIKGDAIQALYSRKWDLVIAHPPCTRLANSGVRWLTSRTPREGYKWSEKENIYICSNPEIWQGMYDACNFFNHFVLYGKLGNKIAIENPVQHKYAKRLIEPHTQIIHPYQHGHHEQKQTCLWLYGLPPLQETNNVYIDMMRLPKKERQRIWWLGRGKSKERSKTFPGIARAMAEQWSDPILERNLFNQ